MTPRTYTRARIHTQGNVEVVAQYVEKHPQVLHEKFTRKMFTWMLEPECFRWFEYVGCTALFVASSMVGVLGGLGVINTNCSALGGL